MNSESLKFDEEGEEPNYYSSSTTSHMDPNRTQVSKSSAPATREKRKRKRQRQSKNKEAAESQRMTHIAVERNRRRQMNDYLNALRSLMPTSYVQGGHQASIIGGAIDFVKELEQLLNSLEAQNRMRLAEQGGENWKMEVRVIEDHVNVKVQCRRKSGQLVKAIVGLEQQLRLTVLHLNITSSLSQDTVLYSFNLKIEDGCGLGSVEEIAAAVQQIFNIINGS